MSMRVIDSAVFFVEKELPLNPLRPVVQTLILKFEKILRQIQTIHNSVNTKICNIFALDKSADSCWHGSCRRKASVFSGKVYSRRG